MVDGEKSVADTALKLKRLVVVADEESAPAVNNPAHMRKLKERIMGAVKSEDESADEPSNVIGQRRMHQRLREVTLASHRGEITELPDNIIQFRPRAKRA